MRVQDFDPNWIRLVTRGGDVDTAVAFLFGLIKLFCRADYYKVLQGSEDDCLWLEEVKIDNRRLQKVMSGSQPVATMDDVFVLFGVMLCNVNLRGRHHLRPRLVPGPGPNEANSRVCLRTVANSTDEGGETSTPGKRHTRLFRAKRSRGNPGAPGIISRQRPGNPPCPETLVTQALRQEPGSNPANVVPREDVICIAAALKTTDVGRSMPPAMTTQKVFVFPSLGQFNATWIRLVTRSIDPVTAVPCLLGFIDLMCGDDFEKVGDLFCHLCDREIG
ncbi:hypothetical protein MRX96_041147 [Rhipicephalus microplus]